MRSPSPKRPPSQCRSLRGHRSLHQETDVLDTWFSSALWPFSTLGWPDSTDELKTFYPTSVLVTGFDILFFWVARMMMMGIHFMGDVPFRDVYIHALVRDAEGKKMSKSKGNVIDPLEVMDRFGTDAFRFTLAAFAAQGRDIKLSEERVLGYRHFVNKIWNGSRFVMMNLEGAVETDPDKRIFTLEDRWILTRLGDVAQEVSKALEEYRFNDAASGCYQFVWHEFCDWYLEMIKPSLYGPDEALKTSVRATMLEVLKAVLKLVHPFMPFVTEEIWHKLPGTQGSIMRADFPDMASAARDEDASRQMKLLMAIVGAVRNIRGEMGVPPGKKVETVMEVPDQGQADFLNRYESYIRNLAKVDAVSLGRSVPKPRGSATAVIGDVQVHVLLKGLIDVKEEKKRLTKEIEKVIKELDGLRKKLANQAFLEKAPDEVVEEVRERVEGLTQRMGKINQNLNILEDVDGAS